MNSIVISKADTSNSRKESEVIIIESELSVIDFDNLFRNTLSDFYSVWQQYNETVSKELAYFNSVQENDSNYSQAMKSFTAAFDTFEVFERHNKVFSHNNYNILLTSFIIHSSELFNFTVLSLKDWVSIKKAESSVGFCHE